MRFSRQIVSISVLCLVCVAAGCQPAETIPNYTSGRPAVSVPAGDNVPLVAEGRNKQLSFKAKQAGTLDLYDPDANQFLFHGPLAAGQQFVFDPASGLATIDKERVDLDHVTNNRDNYQVFFSEQK